MPANVWGGSADLPSSTPVRLCEVRQKAVLSLSLQLDLATSLASDAALVTVISGASQTAQSRTYRILAGRLMVPVVGDFVTVDVDAPGIGPARITAILAETAAAQSPLGSTTGTGETFSVPALGSVDVPGAAGAGRILRNDGAGDVAIAIGGVTAYVLAAGTSRDIAYCGPFVASALVGGDLRVVTLHP